METNELDALYGALDGLQTRLLKQDNDASFLHKENMQLKYQLGLASMKLSCLEQEVVILHEHESNFLRAVQMTNEVR